MKQSFRDIILRIIKNKFTIATAIFFIWIMFLDKNSIRSRLRFRQKIKGMEKEIKYYRKKIQRDSLRILELKSDKESLEKFAREQYFMKEPDEDVFIIVPGEELE